MPRDAEDGGAVERGDRPQVQHGALDTVLRQAFGDAHGDVDERSVGNDGEVVARPP